MLTKRTRRTMTMLIVFILVLTACPDGTEPYWPSPVRNVYGQKPSAKGRLSLFFGLGQTWVKRTMLYWPHWAA